MATWAEGATPDLRVMIARPQSICNDSCNCSTRSSAAAVSVPDGLTCARRLWVVRTGVHRRRFSRKHY